MRLAATIVLSAALLAACAKKQPPPSEQPPQQSLPPATSKAPAKQDVRTETLVKFDPAIAPYQAAVDNARKKYDANPVDKNRKALVEAYIAFAKYMDYDSPVTPRQGKYRRALFEFRHALKLDPDNQEAKKAIQEIEGIYEGMGRTIPSEED